MSIGFNRDTIDKFYTKDKIVQLCISKLNEILQINKTDLIIEPSAGNGSFINAIKCLTTNYIFIDIKPEHNDIKQMDFLNFQFNNVSNSKIIVLGNPPFGRQSSLAIKFIKKACTFCDTFAFILPLSFKKDSLKKHIPLDFHLMDELDLPLDSFTIDNKEYSVPCIFQIWTKKNTFRSKPVLLNPQGFNFVKKNNQPDISFRRVGVNAGNIEWNYEDKSEQSHYFIKFENAFDETLIKKLRSITFDTNNTVGPKSISKQEIISKFNLLF